MAPLYLSASPLKTPAFLPPPRSSPSPPSIGRSSSLVSFQRFEPRRLVLSLKTQRRSMKQLQVVAMAPEEEKLTRRNPLDFPIEWERPKPGRRQDIFPKFSPMKTPLPPPMPYDPPEEDEEEEEKKEEEEREDDPEKEDEDQPDKAVVRRLISQLLLLSCLRNLSGSSFASNRGKKKRVLSTRNRFSETSGLIAA